MQIVEQALEQLIALARGQRLGLVTGPTGWLGDAGHLVDRLQAATDLRCLFAPEHGIHGDLQAGCHVAGGTDPQTGLPVWSLYGKHSRPTTEMLTEVDLLVGCLQDCGWRPYTYSTTLAGCLEACAKHGRPMVVLDRPTPLGGTVCQGNVAGGHFFPTPLPLRPGLTIGEQLRLHQATAGIPAELQVIRLWDCPREAWYDAQPLPWLAPSPNLPTLTATLCFGATVMLEATNISEGRGTTRPFELIGAPWLPARRLADQLNELALPGLLARPTWFNPSFSKHAGELCAGVQLHVTDREALDAPLLGLHLLRLLGELSDGRMTVSAGGLTARYHSPVPWERQSTGDEPEAIASDWAEELVQFQRAAAAVGVGPSAWQAGGDGG